MPVALVTGGARGIGAAISLELAKNNFTVAVCGTRSEDDVRPFMDSLREICPAAAYIRGDIAADAAAIIDGVFDRFGCLDVLVNNAGVAPNVRADLLEMTPDSFDRVLGVNLRGTFFLTQYAARRMLEQRNKASTRSFAAVITLTSISADTSSVNRGEYCISKAGSSMAVKLFAERLAPEGINVYEVRPGIIATDMTAAVRGKYDALIDGGLLPIARMGEGGDVAKVVLALALGYHSYSTGAVFFADGGFELRRL